jgi:hypothetical protein
MAINNFQKLSIGQTYKNSLFVETTSYTLSTANAGGILSLKNDNAEEEISLVIPENSVSPIPVGSSVQIIQNGASAISVEPSTGVTLKTNTGTKTKGEDTTILLVKINTNVWVIPTRSRPPHVFVQDSEPVGAEAGDIWFW